MPGAASGEQPIPDPTIAAVPLRTWPDQLTEAQMREVLALAGWPLELHGQALAVSRCESGWRPGAVGDGGRALGLLQLHDGLGNGEAWGGGWGWWSWAGVSIDEAFDPVTNARVARLVYERSGWAPWTCRPG